MIRLEHVTKYFKTEGEKKYILKDVSFVIPPDINVGILGRNGAGKSTLLRMLGGIDFPTVGTITSDKSFSWPMGLSGGFQGSMTGRQNVKFVCRIYGKSDDEIAKVIDEVKEFSELGDYFDMPIKIYSSGMRGRLSFGLSLSFEFDYLIIDETLSTGDENFKKKAKAALEKKIESCNVLLVSHSMGDLKRICDAGIVVNEGTLEYFENIEDAVAAYYKLNGFTPPIVQKQVKGIIHCSDGKTFDGLNAVAGHYKVRPYAIMQAVNENNGSNIFLKKVFWLDGEEQPKYQMWPNIIENETIVAEGIVFEDALAASLFYMDRVPKANIDKIHVENVMKNSKGLSEALKVKFTYFSEYK